MIKIIYNFSRNLRNFMINKYKMVYLSLKYKKFSKVLMKLSIDW